MVKTRSQMAKVEPKKRVSPRLTRNMTAKEEGGKIKDLPKENFRYTDHENNKNKVKKRSGSKRNSNIDNVSIPQTEMPEEEDNTTDEQLEKLVSYVDTGRMSMREIGRMLGINSATVTRRYRNYKKDPDWSAPRLRGKHQKVYEEHSNFILSLYNKSKDYTQKEITDELNLHFPDLKVKKGTVVQHIKKKMTIQFKSSPNRWIYRSRKLYDHHSKFIARMLKEDAHLSLNQMRLKLLEAYPDLTLSKPSFQLHVNKHLKELYQDSESSRKYRAKKYTEEHIDFIKKIYEKNPRAAFPDIYKKLARAYPDIAMNINGLNWHIREYHDVLYQSMIKGNFARRKLYPEHSKFLLDFIKQHPEAKSTGIYQALLKAFPTLVVKKKSMDEHIRIKLRAKLQQ